LLNQVSDSHSTTNPHASASASVEVFHQHQITDERIELLSYGVSAVR
jgi:hypothetical protein